MHESFSRPTALIIVDVQNDFVSGSLAVSGGDRVAHAIAKYIQDGQGGWENDYIITTQDWHDDPGSHWSDTPNFVDTWPVHCKAGAWGAELHDALDDIDVHKRFYKGWDSAAYSGFEGDTAVAYGRLGLGEWLRERGVDSVDICGIATDYCVKATVLDAVKLGFNATVLRDLTAAVSPEGEEAAINEMIIAGAVVVE